ncbi:hypothetical protein KC339_g133 [Hortaea werneckii]|nr:hypothetical protein KC339_g133 [Hortaea werneckii]
MASRRLSSGLWWPLKLGFGHLSPARTQRLVAALARNCLSIAVVCAATPERTSVAARIPSYCSRKPSSWHRRGYLVYWYLRLSGHLYIQTIHGVRFVQPVLIDAGWLVSKTFEEIRGTRQERLGFAYFGFRKVALEEVDVSVLICAIDLGDKCLVKNARRDLTLGLIIDGHNSVVEAASAIIIRGHLSAVTGIMEEIDRTWLRNEPIHCSQHVVAGRPLFEHVASGQAASTHCLEELADIVYILMAALELMLATDIVYTNHERFLASWATATVDQWTPEHFIEMGFLAGAWGELCGGFLSPNLTGGLNSGYSSVSLSEMRAEGGEVLRAEELARSGEFDGVLAVGCGGDM